MNDNKKLLTDSEAHLIACLGVYGCWILKHGHDLPKDHPSVQRVMAGYQAYLDKGDNAALPLFREIDGAVKVLDWEDVFQDYELAIKDLRDHRRKQATVQPS